VVGGKGSWGGWLAATLAGPDMRACQLLARRASSCGNVLVQKGQPFPCLPACLPVLLFTALLSPAHPVHVPPCTAPLFSCTAEYCARGSLNDVLRACSSSASKASQMTWLRRLNMVSLRVLACVGPSPRIGPAQAQLYA